MSPYPRNSYIARPPPLACWSVPFFLYFAHAGLRGSLPATTHELQHMHAYFTMPLWRAPPDVLNPVSSSYRPMGGLFYRSLYAAAGFHPLPFRCLLRPAYRESAACVSPAADAVRLREAALLGTLLAQLSRGNVRPVLQYRHHLRHPLLYVLMLALTLYAGCRRKGGGLAGRAWAGLVVLDVPALQSKEMAWSLPAILLLYEAVYGEFERMAWSAAWLPAW